MPLTRKGEKILHHMQKEYGGKKGKSVFYASKNKGNISGVDCDDADPELANRVVPPGSQKRIKPVVHHVHIHLHDAEPGTRAGMAAKRVETLRGHARKKSDQLLHKAAGAGGPHSSAKIGTAGHTVKRTMAGPKSRAAGTAKKHGAAVAKPKPTMKIE